MSFDAVAVRTLFASIQSHAMTLGIYETVNLHEPKSAPGRGLHAAIWVDYIGPVSSSGLAATSGVVVLKVRTYSSMLSQPQDAIDPNILSAVTTLLNEYTGNLTLGATVRNVDLLGYTGRKLEAQAGYISISGKMSRVMDITIPCVINDLWVMSP